MDQIRLRDEFPYALLLNKVNQSIQKWDYSEITGYGYYQKYTGHYAYIGIKISKSNDQYNQELRCHVDEELLPLPYLNEVIKNLNFFISHFTAIKGERIHLKFEIIDGCHHVVDSRVKNFHIATFYALLDCFGKPYTTISENQKQSIENCKNAAREWHKKELKIKSLIPKNKDDFQTVERLKNYSFSEIQSIIPDLLEWLQDMNWPISKPIADFLFPYIDHISPEILNILKGNDEMWKYWILISFGRDIKNKLVLNEIERIIKNPTKEEIENNVSEIANEILDL